MNYIFCKQGNSCSEARGTFIEEINNATRASAAAYTRILLRSLKPYS